MLYWQDGYDCMDAEQRKNQHNLISVKGISRTNDG